MTGRTRTTRRKLAVATWRPSRDGRLYGRIAIDATALQKFLVDLRASSGVRVSVTHAVGKAAARAMREVPEAHARVVFGRIVEFPRCDVGFAVDIAGEDLAPVKVAAADTLSVPEIAQALEAGALDLRAGRDPAYLTTSRLARLLPPSLIRLALSLASVVNGGLGRPAFGQPAFPLGSVFVSNVGAFGLDEVLLAQVPFARVPVYVCIGRISDAALVVDGQVVVRPQLIVTFTSDHRIIDGAQAGRFVHAVKEALLDPTLLG